MASVYIYDKILILLCFLTVFINAFEVGTDSTFSFVNDVSLYDFKTAAEQSIGYRISGDLKVSSVYGDSENGFLLRFKLISPQLYLEKFKATPIDYDLKKSILDGHDKLIFYAHWKAGIIEKAFIKDTKDSSLNNFLRSILSLFQYQTADGETVETDVTGTCDIKYIAKSSRRFMKIKTNCKNEKFYNHERPIKSLGCDTKITRVNIIETSADGLLDSIHSSDHHKLSVTAYNNVGFKTGSLFFLKLGLVKSCEAIVADSFDDALKTLDGFTETTLLPEIGDESSEDGNLVKMIKDAKENLKNEDVGKENSALALLNLVSAGRKSKAEDLLRIINGRTTKEIRPQLMDLLAAIQTDESYLAFRSTYNLTDDENIDNIERYLQSLSVGVLPRQSVISHLLQSVDQIENVKIRDTVIQTISSMSNKLANSPNQNYENEAVVNVKNLLLKSLDECEDNGCKLIYIRGLKNLQSPDTIRKLMELALREPYQISVGAMKALSRFNKNDLDGWKKDFKNIFYQISKKFDSSARTIALDILLSLDPDTDDVTDFISFLKSEDPAYEVKQYLVQQLRMLADKCLEFDKLLKLVVKNDPQVYNWNVYGALKGLSTALTRKFSRNPSFDGSLMSVQEIKGGVLKRGNVDLLMEYDTEKFSTFTMGLFAGGLSSFVSSDEEEVDPEEDSTATAGMEIAVQGNYLRPLVFFSGQGELMGHVWSGTGSEPISAYQGITLLQDHKELFVLNNGAILDYSTLGAMSMDLNGQFTVSLWYKNANSVVLQNIGLALLSTVRISSPIVSAEIQTSLSQEPQINLSSKIDFSSKSVMCLQLTQPNIQLTQKITKKVDIPKSKKEKALKNEVYLRYKIPGKTHVLNRKNTDMCNAIME
ncbi:microsomal triacylglycerol transfer protein [Chironomus tepperi]|uniref:microsomal triacylglycerol transfer protein n=1 Tax=Chironomus tepperi TaxID=113505 RepID=UPI00391F6162